jgi:hypothetical protein
VVRQPNDYLLRLILRLLIRFARNQGMGDVGMSAGDWKKNEDLLTECEQAVSE